MLELVSDTLAWREMMVTPVRPPLVDLEAPTAATAQRTGRDLTIAAISSWANRQVSWIARRAAADRHSELFLYTQAAKLVEEVGELHAELLGRSKLQRQGKGQDFSQASLEGEFADVAICLVILAQVAGVDLEKALHTKIEAVNQRAAIEHERAQANHAASHERQSD